MADKQHSTGRARGRARNERSSIPTVGNNSEAPNIPRGGLAPRRRGRGDQSSVQSLQKARTRLLQTLAVPLTRPANVTSTTGHSGAQIELVSNFFRIQGGPSWCMHEYHVDFQPEIEFLSLRKSLLWAHRDKIGEVYVFNGANLVTARELPEESIWESVRETDGSKISLRVRRTGEISPDSEEALRILDLAVRQVQTALDLKQSKRDFFDPQSALSIPDFGLSVWPGFSMTITKYENELLLNLDVVHRVLRTDTCVDVLARIFRQAKDRKQDPKQAAQHELIGAVVLTKYNNKTHTIDDILWPPENTPMSTFDMKGEKISIYDYLRTQYDITVRDKGQPLLVTRPRKLTRRLNEKGRVDKLVPELCYMTGLSDAQRSDFTLMKAFGQATRLVPEQRIKRYCDFAKRVKASETANRILANWNLKLEPEPLRLKGRWLSPVELHAKNGLFHPDQQTAEWSTKLTHLKAFTAVDMGTWAICFPRRDESVARDVADALKSTAVELGFRINPPTVFPLDNIRPDGYKAACAAASQIPNCLMIFCLLSRKDRSIYEAVKKYTLVDVGIPSQCVAIPTLRKGMASVISKVIQQMCVKLGGALWKVPIPMKRTMICGFDTYHDSSTRGMSVGGFVATVDDAFTKFYSRSFRHSAREELSHFMKPLLTDAIKVFHSKTNSLPSNILFYRDGVADNQLRVVSETEVKQLQSVFEHFGADYNPKMAVVVVQKRIRPRFFMDTGYGVINPRPGTIVDNTITNPRSYDFFVISQSVRQGTVTPTRYNIIHESTSIRPDHHHQLAYRLSHLYYNWPGTIRVVAPCHYAHKLAFLVGQHVHSETHRNLWTKLYYL